MKNSIVLMIIKNLLKTYKKEDFFSKLENKCPSDEEIEQTMEIIEKFNIKDGEELTQLYLKSNVFFYLRVFLRNL